LRVTQGLLDARATFQRLDDARITRGWIVGVNGVDLMVRGNEEPPLCEGEKFAVRTSRLTGDVAFIAILRDATVPDANEALRRAVHADRPTMLDFGERTYIFEVLGQMCSLPSSGDPRYACEPGRILIAKAEAELRDVSPGGLGAVSLAAHCVGDIVDIVIELAHETLRFQAEVRYCRGLTSHPPSFRLGMRLTSEDRIERARWLSIVRDRSMAAIAKRLPDGEPETALLPMPEETGVPWACHVVAPNLVFPWGTTRPGRPATREGQEDLVPEAASEEESETHSATEPYDESDLWEGRSTFDFGSDAA